MIAMSKFSPGKAYVLVVSMLVMLSPVQAQTQQTAEWKSVSGPDGGFTVEMPGAPVHTEETKKSGGGTDYTSHTYSIDQGNIAYLIQTAVFPTDVDVSTPKENLQAAIDAIAKILTDGKWTSVTWVERQGLVAVEGQGIQGEVELRYFALLNRSQFISMIYAGPPGSAKTPKVDRFLNSLQIAK